ncbi:D-alanyl-D-alanine carboxypeptidase/D-alanyl-D-alanine-endopeptidase [Roseovarius sp. SCSIO 43702]|uniref:D-alanyl-D-alanine carboxypeptidase/D-alanyl-D-alanine endopeptidase n=1 Tax=Roseovarius sp. SCSIO 43702 TaxID=2823043 RepID=UPI001C73688E|nr:D-alanyl-D-alanine carboxypeptidase/D-alanyl-D-alanine-endopeptidase [Roseovarius sp. SCSIO 43702]QYX56796.1 D-alanyl-D-alanine carboxypeptidase/D-alanyl-D-alanine-endopeptidase [Roseovarius sp. SCSIO 43702]
MTSFTRRAFLSSALSAVATGALADAPATSLRPRARPDTLGKVEAPEAATLIREAKLGGRVGFAVVDVETGGLLETRAGEEGLPPASVAKVVTALYALKVLGPNHRFRTRLIAAGPIVDGVIEGDLVLAGGGDPTLDTNALAQMAADLKAAGIRSVTGRFRTWSGALPYAPEIDTTQPDHVGYNPAVSGLNLNFNRVHFEWKRQGSDYTVTMDARSAKYRPEVRMARMRVVGREMPVYTYANGGDHDNWTVARGALGGGGSRWLPTRHPANYSAEVFQYFARAQGITLERGPEPEAEPEGTALVTHESEELRGILRDMLKYSTNITAELVGLAATGKRVGDVGSLASSGAEMTAWAREELGLSDAAIFVDHSGLGDRSRVTPTGLARALARAHREGEIGPILKDIPLRNADGSPDPTHPVKVQAKTGTLIFVSALAGYATAQDGTVLAFAIFAADEKTRAGIDRATQTTAPGSRSWNKRAKRLQQALIERWALTYTGKARRGG